ncbi:hypothetical protein [Halalkalibacillus halophilus]|uniref:hypothetical protein n=1 Tax=Halalkalibacillus halophilus TaxID=392827 RepID=UPI00048611B6|nr:hypothetical protein [Halalkalibacillus halophilus]
MLKSKKVRLIVFSTIVVFMILWPIFEEFHYLYIYYPVIAVVFSLTFIRVFNEKRFEKRFYIKWEKRRKLGMWLFVPLSTMRTMAIIIFATLFGQLVGENRTPFYIITELPTERLTTMTIVVLIISLLASLAEWYENEKSYRNLTRLKRESLGL